MQFILKNRVDTAKYNYLLGWDSLRPSTVSHSWSYLLISGLLLPTQHLLQHLAIASFLPPS